MLRTTGVILTALAFSQVSAGLVDSEVYHENAISGETIANERIGWGWNASPGQFPFMVQVRFFASVSQWRNCGGSIIHNNWVVSSAYCATVMNRTHARVFASVTDISTVGQSISETSEWWIHPSFNVNHASSVQSYDICILKLHQPLIYNTFVQPIRIESSSDAFKDYTDEVFTTMGWGRDPQSGYPNVLNWVYLRGISRQECRSSWPASTDYHICAEGLHNSSQSTCTNDEGGPLIQKNQHEEPVLVGVTSFSHPCGNGRPSSFNRIAPFHSWVNNITGIDFDEATEPPTIEATEPPTTEATEPPTTEATEPPTTEAPEPPTTATEPPTTEAPEPPTTATEPPTTEAPELPTTEATEPPTTEVTEPPTTEATEPPTTEATEPPTTATKPPTTEATKPPTTEATEPSTTEATEPPTTEATESPTTETPEPDSEETDKDSNESDNSESEEDPEISELLNKLQVKVKVKVKVNSIIKKNVTHSH